MRKLIISASLSLIATSAMSADERTAANIVKKYSETVACQIQEVQYQKNQYKAVKIIQGDKELGGLGDLFVVYWEGDVGCMGGIGRTGLMLALLAKSFGEEDPVRYVRATYYSHAVETAAQKQFIAEFKVPLSVRLRIWLKRKLAKAHA